VEARRGIVEDEHPVVPLAFTPGGSNAIVPLFLWVPAFVVAPVLGLNHEAATSTPEIVPMRSVNSR
jgi:hypothetical protein